jgi:hypothetical protein
MHQTPEQHVPQDRLVCDAGIYTTGKKKLICVTVCAVLFEGEQKLSCPHLLASDPGAAGAAAASILMPVVAGKSGARIDSLMAQQLML